MFDTGAFHSNYINPNFLRRHWQMLSPMVFHDPSVIMLADGKTSVQCDQVAIFDISFVNGEELLIAEGFRCLYNRGTLDSNDYMLVCMLMVDTLFLNQKVLLL
jgi:hypothetical protein